MFDEISNGGIELYLSSCCMRTAGDVTLVNLQKVVSASAAQLCVDLFSDYRHNLLYNNTMSSVKTPSSLNFGIDSILQSSKRKRLDYSHAHRPPSPVTFKFALPSLTGLSPSCARPTSESIVHLYGYERPTYAVPPGCYSSDVFGYNQLNYPAENMGSLRFRDNIPPSCWDANNIMNTVPSIVQRLPLAVSFRSQPTYAPTAGQLTTPSRSTANSNAVGSRHGHTASKRKKTWTRAVFSSLQRKGLERSFVAQQYISKKDRRKLAATLGLTDSQVRIWYANRRMKAKKSPKIESAVICS